ARQVTTGPVQAGDKSSLDRVDRYPEDNRNDCGSSLSDYCRRSAASRNHHRYLTTNQFGRKRRQTAVVPFRPAIFDLHVLALDISCLFQPLAERAQTDRVRVRRRVAKEPDHRHRWLLRLRRERPCGCRAAEQRDELAALHSITSSARASKVGGTSMPSALAVLRLTTS